MALDPNIQNAVGFGVRDAKKNEPCLALTLVDRRTAGLTYLALDQLRRTSDATTVLAGNWKLKTSPQTRFVNCFTRTALDPSIRPVSQRDREGCFVRHSERLHRMLRFEKTSHITAYGD